MSTSIKILSLLAITSCFGAITVSCSGSQDAAPDGPGGKGDDLGSSCKPSDMFAAAHEIEPFIVAKRRITRDDVASLSEVTAAQLAGALAKLVPELEDKPRIDLESAIDLVDDGLVDLLTISVDTEDHFVAGDWISMHVGDTQVGIVFWAGSTVIHAEIADGSVLSCGDIGWAKAALAVRERLLEGVYEGVDPKGDGCEVTVRLASDLGVAVSVGTAGGQRTAFALAHDTTVTSSVEETADGVLIAAENIGIDETGQFDADSTIEISQLFNLDVRATTDHWTDEDRTQIEQSCLGLTRLDDLDDWAN